jgi:hypothetical protein
VNASQPDLPPEGVFDGFLYPRADPYDRLHTNSWVHTGNGLKASRSSILPKQPLKALWNSLSNSVQNTSLRPSIYRLTGDLKLLRLGLWLSSVRTEVNLIRTIFCNILSETAQFYLYQVHIRTAWPSVRTVFAKILFTFERNSGIFWTTGHHPDVLPRRPKGLQRLPKQCRLLKLNTLLNTDWPSVRTVLL